MLYRLNRLLQMGTRMEMLTRAETEHRAAQTRTETGHRVAQASRLRETMQADQEARMSAQQIQVQASLILMA